MTVVNLSRLHDDTIVSGEDALASDIDGELDQIVNIHQNISHPDVVSMFRNATAYSNGQLDINTAAKDIAIGDTVNMFGLSTFDIQPHLAAGLAQYDCVYHSGVAVDSDTIYVRKADNTDVDSGKKYVGLMMQAVAYGQRGACRFAGLIYNSAWSLTPSLPVYIGTAGAITQTRPEPGATALYCREIGIAFTANAILLRAGEFIIF